MSDNIQKPAPVLMSSVAGSVPASLREAVEAYRWQHRMTVSDVLRAALTDWATAHNLLEPETLDTVEVPEVAVPVVETSARTRR